MTEEWSLDPGKGTQKPRDLPLLGSFLGWLLGGKVQAEEASPWMAHSLVHSFIQQAFIEYLLHARLGAKNTSGAKPESMQANIKRQF